MLRVTNKPFMLSVGKLDVVMLSVAAPVQCLLFIALGAHQNKLECFLNCLLKSKEWNLAIKVYLEVDPISHYASVYFLKKQKSFVFMNRLT